MWEAIKRAKRIPPDRYDQTLDGMIRRTLEQEIVPFDEWQDLVDDLKAEQENAPDIETILQKHGLTLPVLVEEAEAARRDFLNTLHQCGLPPEDRFKLCQLLYEQVCTAPSDELLRLYCDIVCDGGFLLDQERAGDDGAVCWLYTKEDSDALYTHLSKRMETAAQFKKTLEKARKINPLNLNCAAEDSIQVNEVFQAYVQLFNPSGNRDLLLGNIAQLLQIADRSDALAPIKPLFLYRVLTRHGKRMQTSEDLRIDFDALWNRQEYKIDQDNGKNYQTNMRYLELFSRLFGIFTSDSCVELPLCVYGFDQLSNLGEFYRSYPSWPFDIPFAPSIEELLDESLFTCFEYDHEDNVVMTESGISPKTLERFRCSTERRRARALARISEYMNRHIADWIPRFLNASSDEVKSLCAEILEAAALPIPQQPKTPQEAVLFLATINGGLMEAVDYFAMEYLAAAGKTFIT